MRRWLLEYLVCPESREPLELVAGGDDDDVIAGELRAVRSGKTYRIVNGVPRFVAQHYAGSFGLQWRRHSRTQYDTTQRQQSRERFFGETGFSESALAGTLLLDAGCGSGRFARVAAEAGARTVAVDLSEAVDAAYQNLAAVENVAVVQASIYELPFRPGTFDFVSCLGVIQHTPDPLGAVRCLADMARPAGGEIGLWWYKRYWWTLLQQKYVLRPVFRNWTPERLYRFVSWYVPKLLPVSRAVARLPLMGPPRNLVEMVLPVAIRDAVDGLTDAEKVEWAVLDTFDWYSPRYDQPQPWSAVESILRQRAYRTQRTSRHGLHGTRLSCGEESSHVQARHTRASGYPGGVVVYPRPGFPRSRE